MIASPAETFSVFCVAKDRGKHDDYWCQKTKLFRVGEASELLLTIHLEEGDSDLKTPNCLGWFKTSAGITI